MNRDKLANRILDLVCEHMNDGVDFQDALADTLHVLQQIAWVASPLVDFHRVRSEAAFAGLPSEQPRDNDYESEDFARSFGFPSVAAMHAEAFNEARKHFN